MSAIAATDTLPIVMIAVDYDPFARGYVQNLARPGGTVTGVFFQQIELAMKRLQLMKEALPDVAAATVFWDDGSADQWRATQSAAETMGLKLTGVELGNPPYDYENGARAPLVAQAPTDHHRILVVLSSPVFFPTASASLSSRFAIASHPCSCFADMSMLAVCSHTDRASTRCTIAPPNTWIGLRRERIQPTCRWSNRPSSN